MPGALRTPIRLNVTSLACKIEAGYGTDAVPVNTANAIALRGKPTLTPMEMTEESRDLLRPYFGNDELLPGTYYGKFSFQVEAAGSGAAGTVPSWGALARGCGYSETITAAPIAASAQAGGSVTTIKLAAGASAVDDFYNGMPITITAGTGDGQKGIIVDYDGTSKVATVVSSTWAAPDATSEYSIGANVVYKPVSSTQESLSSYWDLDGIVHKFVGVRGNMTLSFDLNKVPSLGFDFMGIYGSVADRAMPTSVFTGWKRPLIFNNANTPLFSLLNNSGIGLESLSYDTGNVIEHHELANLAEQFMLTGRQPKAGVSMEAVKLAIQDWWTGMTSLTAGPMAMTHGVNAGNILTLSGPNVQVHKPEYGERGNVRLFRPELIFNPITGDDEVALCAY